MRALFLCLAALILSTGCSDIKFDSGTGSSQKLDGVVETGPGEGGPGTEEGAGTIIDPDLPPIEQEIIERNEGCQILADFSTGDTSARAGNNFHFNGNMDYVFAENADNVVINGNIGGIGILGANHVVVNGNKKDVCIVAKKISGLNGNIRRGQSAVLVGEFGRDNSRLGAINGNSDTEILIKNMTVNDLNGNFDLLVLDNVTAGSLNGNVEEIHLFNNSTLKQTNGNIGKIVYH